MSRQLPPPTNFLFAIAISVVVMAVAERLHDRKVAITAVKEAGGTMGFRYWKPDWLRKLVNDNDCFWAPVRITLPPSATDKTDDEILQSLGDTLRTFRNLTALDIRNTQITDKSAKVLGRLKWLSTLRLANTNVGDQTVREIVKLKDLRWLKLDGTQITDACIDDLAKLKHLTNLTVVDTKLSEEAILKLSRKLPQCKIEF